MVSEMVKLAGLQPPSIAPQRPNSKVRTDRDLRRYFSWCRAIGVLIIVAWLLTACRDPLLTPAPTATTPLAPSLPDDVTGAPADALAALIAVERQASVDRDQVTLAQLWSQDGRIVDGRNTAAPGDDYIWAGRDAIMDRYVMAVFPNPPPPLRGPDVLAGLVVQAESDTIATGTNGGDQWRLVYADGRWWLQELVYQQP